MGVVMAMDIEQVRWVAHLARLEMSESELAQMAEQLGAIVEYVQQLQQVDTAGIEPLAHPFALNNVFRPDDPMPSLGVDAALSNAPERIDNYFGVPAVLD